MIRLEGFWEKERDAPLLDQNRGFLAPNQPDTIFERVALWPALLNPITTTTTTSSSSSSSSNDNASDTISKEVEVQQQKPDKSDEVEKAEEELSTQQKPDRIFVLDAERTFASEENRQRLIRLLMELSHNRFGGHYHQGLSYVASFLLLTLEEANVIRILEPINSDAKFIPGYWRDEAIAFATDAFVFQSLVEQRFPDVAAHLKKLTIQPHTFAQKWFVALCVHVLPFEALFNFLELFFQQGFHFLFQFALSLIEHIRPALLATQDHATVFALLRLDFKSAKRVAHLIEPNPAASSENFVALSLAIVEGASRFTEIAEIDFAEKRRDAFDQHLKKQLEAAERQRKLAEEAGDESDNESEEWDSDEDHGDSEADD